MVLREREGDISKGVPITVASTRLTFDDAVKDVIADYITTASGNAFTYTPNSATTRALLHVNFQVNINPNEGWKTWRLVDDIVLRNTLRQ